MTMSPPERHAASHQAHNESAGAPPVPRTAEPRTPVPLTVVRRRRPGRWIAAAVVAVLAAQLVYGMVTNPAWDWGTFARFFASKSVLSALLVTVELTFYSALLGFALGLVLALMRLSASPPLRAVAANSSSAAPATARRHCASTRPTTRRSSGRRSTWRC